MKTLIEKIGFVFERRNPDGLGIGVDNPGK